LTPWHYTTVLDLIDHWQTFIAGAFALIAAAVTVGFTLRSEQRGVEREIDALRKSLGIEIRQLTLGAFGAANSLRGLSANPGPITARMVEVLFNVRAPVIYNSNAFKIGLLEADAMDVVIFYGLLESARETVRRIGESREPDDIDRDIVLQLSTVLLGACECSGRLLPRMRTGVASHDDGDALLIQSINAASKIAESAPVVATSGDGRG
jgi:hypothetical protein